MNYFLNKPQTQKLMSDEELMALALQNKERAQAQRKKKRWKAVAAAPLIHLRTPRDDLENMIYAKILIFVIIGIILSYYF